MKQRQMIIGMCVLLAAVVAFLPVPVGAGTAATEDTAGADNELVLPKLIPSCMVQPVYPEQEKIDGIQGTVLLGVEIRADGTVASAKAEQEVQDHPAFTAAAITAVRKWCFEPARKDDQAVACTVKIPVRFALDEKKK